jgi:hypothetical protein
MSGMRIKVTGMDEFSRKLETLQRRAANVSGQVPFDELFPPEFMRRYTSFKSIEDMLAGFETPIESAEDFKKIPDADWNAFVKERTKFKSWEDMQTKAGEEFIERRLNLENL